MNEPTIAGYPVKFVDKIDEKRGRDFTIGTFQDFRVEIHWDELTKMQKDIALNAMPWIIQ